MPAAQKVLGILISSHGAAASPYTMKLNKCHLSHHDLYGVFSWTCVQTLDLSNNQLQRIPGSLSRLVHLRELNLSRNLLKTLPKTIGKLTQLRSLDVSHNILRAEAISVSRAASLFVDGALAKLFLQGNPNLRLPPSDVIERGPEAVKQFCKDMIEGEAVCWTQTMLVVGQQEAGKTALCHALGGVKCLDRPQRQIDSTVGIDTLEWKITVGTMPRCNDSPDGCAPSSPLRVRVRHSLKLRHCFNAARLSGTYRGHVFIRGHMLTLPDSKGQTQELNLRYGFSVSLSNKSARTLHLRSNDKSTFQVGNPVFSRHRNKWMSGRVLQVLPDQSLRVRLFDISEVVQIWKTDESRLSLPHKFELNCESDLEAGTWLRILLAACGKSTPNLHNRAAGVCVSDASVWYSGCWEDGGTLSSDGDSLLHFRFQQKSMAVEIISSHLSVSYVSHEAIHVLHDRGDSGSGSGNFWIVRTDVPLKTGDLVRQKNWPRGKKGKLWSFDQNRSIAHVKVGTVMTRLPLHKIERFFQLKVALGRLKDFAGQATFLVVAPYPFTQTNV